jgi:F420-dependent oxidoreductase-like protein
MRIGLQIIEFNWPGHPQNIGSKLREIAQAADANGFYSLWVMDHYFQMESFKPATDPMMEGYSTASYMAAVTDNIKLGLLVTGIIYRYPGILAKTITTLDVLSGGRAYLGVGAAWYEREAIGLGLPYPSTSERFEQLEEFLQLVHQMWKDDTSPFEGKHFQLPEPLNHPQPLSKPHPPIMIGGMGEQKTLRMVAQYGDACNLFFGTGKNEQLGNRDMIQHKLNVIKQHCEDVGRDYDDIEKTILGTVNFDDGTTPDDVLEVARAYADMGIDHMIFNMPNSYEITPIETFGEKIIPVIEDL